MPLTNEQAQQRWKELVKRSYPHNGICPLTGLIKSPDEFFTTASLDQMRGVIVSLRAAREWLSRLNEDDARRKYLETCDAQLQVMHGLADAVEDFLRICDADGLDTLSDEHLADYHRYKGTGKPKLYKN